MNHSVIEDATPIKEIEDVISQESALKPVGDVTWEQMKISLNMEITRHCQIKMALCRKDKRLPTNCTKQLIEVEKKSPGFLQRIFGTAKSAC